MTDQVNVPGQPSGKKKMSKGCLVAIIIVGSIIVLGSIGIGYVCMNPDTIVTAGARYMVVEMKNELANNPVEGVDGDRFNKVADAFNVKMDEPEQDLEKLGLFAQAAGGIVQDQPYTAERVEDFVIAMVACYPDLEELAGFPCASDIEEVTDSTIVDSVMTE